MEIIIEEINRGKKLLHRHKFFTQKITIGRSYHNDIILADPHICPDHLSIEYTGEHWIVKDHNSINGCYINSGKQKVVQHIVKSGDIIHFGKSQIRLILPDHPISETLAFSSFEGFIDLMRNPLVLSFNVLFFAFIAGMMFYLNQPSEVNPTQFIVKAVGVTLMFAIWPLFISIISHLNKHEARIFTQLAISFALFNLMWLSDVFESIVEFNLSSNWPIASIITLLPIALTFILIWLNFYIGFQMSERRRTIIALSITAVLFGGGYILQQSKQPEFSSRPDYDATIMTPTFKFTASSSVDKFISDSSKLFAKVEKLAQKQK
jgi:hypothetical protein